MLLEPHPLHPCIVRPHVVPPAPINGVGAPTSGVCSHRQRVCCCCSPTCERQVSVEVAEQLFKQADTDNSGSVSSLSPPSATALCSVPQNENKKRERNKKKMLGAHIG